LIGTLAARDGRKDPAKSLAQEGAVTRAQIDAALRYRHAYPDEIQARIDLHRSHTQAAARA
jgi:hypothetical protein